jgi:hypothetical protein
MARPRHYFEPWHVSKPAGAGVGAIWDEGRIVWGSGMSEPCVAETLDGRTVVMDDRRIIARVATIVSDLPNPPKAEDVAWRIAASVNACAGIRDPEDALNRTRQLLLDLVLGKADASDSRVLACLDRLGPAEGRFQQRHCSEAGPCD